MKRRLTGHWRLRERWTLFGIKMVLQVHVELNTPHNDVHRPTLTYHWVDATVEDARAVFPNLHAFTSFRASRG